MMGMLFSWRVAILTLLAFSNVVLAVRFKIAIPRDEAEELYERLTKREEPCQVVAVESPNDLKLPGVKDEDRPWVKNQNVKLFTNAEVTKGIDALYKLKVPGLGDTKISAVIEYLAEQGCLSFPYGGCVRDQFLKLLPADLDMESNCNADTLEQKCKDKWGADLCPRYQGSAIMHIGVLGGDDDETDIIDASGWDETFFGDGTKLEYTTNSVAYYAGEHNIILDITGNGVDDSCKKKIRIPVSQQSRDNWVADIKVFRFWKLRVKEYTAIDESTSTYITGKVTTMMTDNPAHFKSYYCMYALLGKWKKADGKCNIENSECAHLKKSAFDKAFAADLKKDDVWTKIGLPLIEKLECTSCPDLQSCK